MLFICDADITSIQWASNHYNIIVIISSIVINGIIIINTNLGSCCPSVQKWLQFIEQQIPLLLLSFIIIIKLKGLICT